MAPVILKKDGVILLSGGLDSVTLLYDLKNNYPDAELHALNMYYGQRHEQESKYAKMHCEKLNIPYTELKLDFIPKICANTSSLIKSSELEVPNQEYNPDETPNTYVPFRNAIFTTIAAGYCESNNLTNIYYAAHKGDDKANYWDCTPQFVEYMNDILYFRKVALVAPFIDKTKEEIVKVAMNYKDLDLSKTWSCYNGADIHCGVCSTCRERILAMKNAGYNDKTEYMQNPYEE